MGITDCPSELNMGLEWSEKEKKKGEDRENSTKLGFVVCLREKPQPNKAENRRHPMRKGAKSQKEWQNTDECVEHLLQALVSLSSRSGA